LLELPDEQELPLLVFYDNSREVLNTGFH
jgi:hypothetical protein